MSFLADAARSVQLAVRSHFRKSGDDWRTAHAEISTNLARGFDLLVSIGATNRVKSSPEFFISHSLSLTHLPSFGRRTQQQRHRSRRIIRRRESRRRFQRSSSTHTLHHRGITLSTH